MASLFHYTNASGLIGILSSNSLFATDYRFMNDPSELGEARKLIVPVFEAEIARLTPELAKKNFLSPEFYKELGTRGHLLQAESLYSAVVKAANNASPFFLFSFCRHSEKSDEYNHGLLSQWRGYSSGGGFALEFDEVQLDKMLNEEIESFAYAGYRTADVAYENHEKHLKAADYEQIAREMLRKLFSSHDIDISDVTGPEQSLDKLFLSFLTTAPFLKNSGFKEECEYRISALCIRKQKIPKGMDKAPKTIKFRSRDAMIIPYIDLFSTLGKKLPLKSIVVGPHLRQVEQVEAAKLLVETYDYNVPIRVSEIPLR